MRGFDRSNTTTPSENQASFGKWNAPTASGGTLTEQLRDRVAAQEDLLLIGYDYCDSYDLESDDYLEALNFRHTY